MLAPYPELTLPIYPHGYFASLLPCAFAVKARVAVAEEWNRLIVEPSPQKPFA
jgi:hypothetical protein